MVIEINKDIDRYKESVVMGLTAKQLIFSVASVVAGGKHCASSLPLYRINTQCICGDSGGGTDCTWRILQF